MKNFLLAILALAVFPSVPAHALQEILRNYRGPRSLGMGGTVTTTGHFDDALFGNPATLSESPEWKLTILSPTIEVNSNLISDSSKIRSISGAQGADVVTKLIDAGILGRNEHFGFSNLTAFYSPKFFGERTGLGLGLLVNARTNLLLRSTARVDAQILLDAGPAIGIAHWLLPDVLSVGFNLRMIYRLAGDRTLGAVDFIGGQKLSASSLAGQGIGLDGDLGVFFVLPIEISWLELSTAASLSNVGASNYRFLGRELVPSITGRPPGNDRVGNFGVRGTFSDFGSFTSTVAAIEWQDIGPTTARASFFKKSHIGFETHTFSNRLALRFGLNQGYVGGGFGIDLPILNIDLATYGEELGERAGDLEDRRYVLRLAFEI